MTITFAPQPWSAPATSAYRPSWRFGREVRADDGCVRLVWDLKRHCSISPAQLATVFAGLCAVSLLIAAGFWWLGAPAVLAFAGLELLALGVALLAHARHAGDREVLALQDRELTVQQTLGPRQSLWRFRADWLRVEPTAGQGSLIQLSGQGQAVQVGRFLRPEQRSDLAGELRRALRDEMKTELR